MKGNYPPPMYALTLDKKIPYRNQKKRLLRRFFVGRFRSAFDPKQPLISPSAGLDSRFLELAPTVVAWYSTWEIRLFVRRFFHPRLVSLDPRLSPRCARRFPRACGSWRARVLP